MKTIKLKSITLINFKGVKFYSGNFDSLNCTVQADNRIGKTTLLDAYNYLLIDKNSQYESDFSIKTLDINGEVIHNLNHEVSAVFDIDGKEISLRKVYNEVWQKKRSSGVETLTKHETTCYFNGVNTGTISEYQKNIRDNFGDEEILKLVTSPMYFASRHWTKRRSILIDMAGGIDPCIVFAGNNRMLDTYERIKKAPVPDRYPAELSAKIKAIKEEREKIPVKIEEIDVLTPEPENWDALQTQIKDIEASIDSKMREKNSILESDKEELKRQQGIQNQIFSLQEQISAIYSKQKDVFMADYYKNLANYRSKKSEVEKIIITLKDLGEKLLSLKNQKSVEENELNRLREQYKQINASEFVAPEDNSICPITKSNYCIEALVAKKEEAHNHFKEQKAKNLEANIAAGSAKKNKIQEIDSQILEIESKLDEISKEDHTLPIEPILPEYIQTPTDEILELEEQIKNLTIDKQPKDIDIQAKERYDSEITSLQSQLPDLRKRLGKKDIIATNNARKKQLLEQDKTLSQGLTNLEKEQDDYLDYNKEYMESVNNIVSKHFKYIKFKMFNQLINSSLEDTCEIIYDGTPYPDCNTERKINAGLDIINAISNYYGISATVWIDNAETVSEFITTKAQTIRLEKVRGINELTIKF